MKRLIPLLCFVVTGVTSCVVSDEIEFHERINMPPVLVSVAPSNRTINNTKYLNNEKPEFTIKLWDPDEDDGSLYQGYIWVIEQLNPDPDAFFCPSVEYTEPDPREFNGGVMVTISCFPTFQIDAKEVTTVILQVDVSDRGFITRDQAREGANQLQVNWTIEAFPSSLNK